MVEAEDGEAAAARVPAHMDVILRIDLEPPRRVGRDVPRRRRRHNRVSSAKQQSTAFGGRRLARMRDDGVDHSPRKCDHEFLILSS
jgi:hypothetical protein